MSSSSENLDPPALPEHLLQRVDAVLPVAAWQEEDRDTPTGEYAAVRIPSVTEPMIPIAPAAPSRELSDLIPQPIKQRVQQLLARLPWHREQPTGPEWPVQLAKPAPQYEHRRLLSPGRALQIGLLVLTLAGIYGVARNTSSTPPRGVPVTSAAPTATTPPIATPTQTPPPPKSTPTPQPAAPKTFPEKVDVEYADEYSNPKTMTVDGVEYKMDDLVPVACVYISSDSANALPEGGGILYRLPNGKYVLANAFGNGGGKVDPRVPICGDSPRQVLTQLKASLAEQGVANYRLVTLVRNVAKVAVAAA